jgi:hypothetical protein
MTMINNTTASTATVPTAAKPAGVMDQKDFLRLMTTQLTTQDPFNPVDNTQMVAQMAQFSQVAGIAEMNKSLANISAALAPGRLNDAASWIGRSMLVDSSVATPLRDGAYAGEIALPKDADQLSISYVDDKGAVVIRKRSARRKPARSPSPGTARMRAAPSSRAAPCGSSSTPAAKARRSTPAPPPGPALPASSRPRTAAPPSSSPASAFFLPKRPSASPDPLPRS